MALQKHEGGKYEGKYVAYDLSEGKKVIASGNNSGKVVDRAREQGVEVPTVVFVPKKGMAYIY